MTAKEIMIQYLLLKVEQKDWHGVSDAANDLREMEAKKEKKEWVGLTDMEAQNIVYCRSPNIANLRKAEQILKDKNT